MHVDILPDKARSSLLFIEYIIAILETTLAHVLSFFFVPTVAVHIL